MLETKLKVVRFKREKVVRYEGEKIVRYVSFKFKTFTSTVAVAFHIITEVFL